MVTADQQQSKLSTLNDAEQLIQLTRNLSQKAIRDGQEEGPITNRAVAMRDKFVKQAISVAKDIKRYKIQPKEDLTGIKPNGEPYHRPGSEQLFKDLKTDEEQKVREAL